MSMFRRGAYCFPSLLALVLLTAVANAQNQTLFSSLSLNTGASLPSALVGGDFNGDGIQDVATFGNGNSIAVYLGKGDGNFQPAVDYPVSNGGVDWIATGDFNRDGHLDLAVSTESFSQNSGGVQILLGKGDGTFANGASYNLGLVGGAITTGDLDGDGIADVAVLGTPLYSPSNQSLIVLHGNGDGTFSGTATYAAGVGLSPSLITGDFNQDGKPDLALSTGINGVSYVGILINAGSSGFQLQPGCAAAQYGRLVAADFNHDGKLDLASTNSGTNTVTICEGNGDGTFSVAGNPAVGNQPSGLAAGDLNGDGLVDLVATNAQDGTLSVLLGNGDETFKNSVAYKVGNLPLTVLLADENGDGKLDATVANLTDGTVQVLLGDGTGKLRAGTFPAATANPVAITNADFNHDGIPDLVTLGGDGSVTISLGLGNGGFQTLSAFQGCTATNYKLPQKIVAADLNGDGKVDLVALCFTATSNAYLSFFSGNGDGTFTTAPGANLGVDSALTAADLNGDGIPEVLVTVGSDVISINFSSASFLYNTLNDQASDISAGDFNGDGKTDLLLQYPSTGSSQVLVGDGHGNFTAQAMQPFTGFLPVVSDFNGDGLADLELSLGEQNIVLLGNGDGTFQSAFDLPAVFSGSVLADFNGDGALDLASPDPGGGILLGQEDGTFVKAGTLPVSQGHPTTADFDGNGSPDIAVVDAVSGVVSILLNKKGFDLTATSLSLSTGTVVAGQPLVLSASVVSKNGTPTGSVTFKQAGAPQATVGLTNGAAQSSFPAPAAIGQYGYTALYTGDGTFSGSLSQRLTFAVTAASTTTVVTSSGSPSKFGNPVTFTATIHPEYSGQPTGTVQFYADGSPLGSSTVSNGQATFTTATLAMGTHTIQADYSGDTNFLTSLGSARQKVGDSASSVALSSSLNPSVYGQAVTLTAVVTDSGGTSPSGFVVFTEPGVVYGTVTLSGGEAQITLPTIAAGKHTITAQYGGDSSDGSAKASLVQVVAGAPSTTTVGTSAEPSIYGQSVTFTAVITSASGTPDGTVTFKNGSSVLGTALLSGGQASLSVSTLTGGAHTINVVYSGSSSYATSSGSVAQVVEATATTTTLTSSLNPAPSGQTVTFTATVTSAAAAAPAGKVTFSAGKTILGTAQLVNGAAQISTAVLASGSHTITATYAGNASYLTSTAGLGQAIQ